MNPRHSHWRFAPYLVFLSLLAALPSLAQVRAGAAGLRLVPGARHEGMAGAFTGAVDELPAIYLNPAALGFARQWQWSATYNKWIADIYQASFVASRRLNFLGLCHTSAALGLTYLGMPDFDSTDGKAPAVSANDVLASFALSQRFGSGPIAVGANVKYLRSELGAYHEQTVATDIGLLVHPLRFRLLGASRGFGEYGYVSAGVSLLNLGKDLKFANHGTPLPRMWRAGASFHSGTHHGLQVLLAADVAQVKSEPVTAALGTELWWSGYAGLRMGYSFDDDQFNNFVFGAGLQLFGLFNSSGSRWGRDNNAARLDVASATKDELFGATYRGSLSHYPVLPESFDLLSPDHNEFLYDDSALLQWQASRDPDPFDNARYLLLVAYDDSLQIRRAMNTALKDFAALLEKTPRDGFLVFTEVDSNAYRLPGLFGGDYYWAVVAFDKDRHVRLAGAGHQGMRRFTVADQNLMITGTEMTPPEWVEENADLVVTSIEFEHSPWITTTPEQGTLRVTVENRGRLKVDSVRLALYDRFLGAAGSPTNALTEKNGLSLVHAKTDSSLGSRAIEGLALGEHRVLEFPWQTGLSGRHKLIAMVDEVQTVPELERQNNHLSKIFSTIPKGNVVCPPVNVVLNINDLSNDVPFIAVAFFDKGEARVEAEHLRRWALASPLKTLAQRMRANPNRKIKLQGYADPLSEESSVTLADARSTAVRDELITHGALPEQISMLPGKVLDSRRLPANADDAEAVLQERRCVNILADTSTSAALFQPMHVEIKDSVYTPVTFSMNLQFSEPLTFSELLLNQSQTADRLRLSGSADSCLQTLPEVVGWDVSVTSCPGDWIGKSFAYELRVQDKAGRHFRTRESTARLDAAKLQVKHQIYGPAKFGKAEPLYELYWAVLFSELSRMLNDKTLRVRFIGHACSIGSLEVNEKLSRLRAEKFRERFLEEIRARMPEHYAELQDRVDLAVGLGETVPLRIDVDNSTRALVGNNRSPLGRWLNRRIEVTFYTPTEQLTSAEPRVK